MQYIEKRKVGNRDANLKVGYSRLNNDILWHYRSQISNRYGEIINAYGAIFSFYLRLWAIFNLAFYIVVSKRALSGIKFPKLLSRLHKVSLVKNSISDFKNLEPNFQFTLTGVVAFPTKFYFY